MLVLKSHVKDVYERRIEHLQTHKERVRLKLIIHTDIDKITTIGNMQGKFKRTN